MSRFQDEKSAMSFALSDERAIRWAGMLESIERSRTGRNKEEVRENVAAKLGVSPGTLENLERRRTKGVKGWIIDRIQGAVIRELEREISRLQHELEIARQCGTRPDADEVIAALAAISEARALIKQASI